LAGEAEILRCVTFAVQAEEVFSVVGPSGAGKSILLRTINRLVESTAGNIFLDGASIEEINPLELRRRIGMVPDRHRQRLTTLLGLVNDPKNKRNEKGYKHRPEQQHEQHAEEATAHHAAANHRSHAAHHAASTESRDEQQDGDRSGQGSKEYLQAVAHGLLTPSYLLV
jgi:ABC-type cobalamin/Fe3+-siderophores transport system ATPase subunit